MFESDDSGDDFDSSSIKTHVFKTKEEVPLKVWAQHFVAPEKERNVSLSKIFEKEFVRLKGMYCFLDETQVMGKTLTKLGIPNILGKVNKKLLLAVLKPRNKPRRLDKSGRRYPALPYRPFTKKIFTSKSSDKAAKPYYPPVAERWSEIALKKFKTTSDHKSSAETYNFNTAVCESKTKQVIHADSTYPNTIPSDWANLNIVSEPIVNKKSDQKSELHKQLNKVLNVKPAKENSNTSSMAVLINEPISKSPENVIGKRLSTKKSVRFNDEGLCEFAPSQIFKDSPQQWNIDDTRFDKLMNPLIKHTMEPSKRPSCKELALSATGENIMKTNSSLSTSAGAKKPITSNIGAKMGSNVDQPVNPVFEIEPYDIERFLIEDWSEVSNSSEVHQKYAIKTNNIESENKGIKTKQSQELSKSIYGGIHNQNKIENLKFGHHNSKNIHNVPITIENTNLNKNAETVIEETPSNSEQSNEKDKYSPDDKILKKHLNLQSSTFIKVCYTPDKCCKTNSLEGIHTVYVESENTPNKHKFDDGKIINNSTPSKPNSIIKDTTIRGINVFTNTQTKRNCINDSNKLEITSPLSDRDYISDNGDLESEEEISDNPQSATNVEGNIKFDKPLLESQKNVVDETEQCKKNLLECTVSDDNPLPMHNYSGKRDFEISSQLSTEITTNECDTATSSDIIIEDTDSEKQDEQKCIPEITSKKEGSNSISTSESNSKSVNELDKTQGISMESLEKITLRKDKCLQVVQHKTNITDEDFNTKETNMENKIELSDDTESIKHQNGISLMVTKCISPSGVRSNDFHTPYLTINNTNDAISNSNLSLANNAPIKRIKATQSLNTTVLFDPEKQDLQKKSLGENKTRKCLFNLTHKSNDNSGEIELGVISGMSLGTESFEKCKIQGENRQSSEEPNNENNKNKVTNIVENESNKKQTKIITIKLTSSGTATADKMDTLLNRKIFDITNVQDSYVTKLNDDKNKTSNKNDDIIIQSKDLFSQISTQHDENKQKTQLFTNDNQETINSSYYKTLMYCKQFPSDTSLMPDNIEMQERNAIYSTRQDKFITNIVDFNDAMLQREYNQTLPLTFVSQCKILTHEYPNRLENKTSLGCSTSNNLMSESVENPKSEKTNDSRNSNTVGSSLIMFSSEKIPMKPFKSPGECSISELSFIDLESMKSKDSLFKRSNPVLSQKENIHNKTVSNRLTVQLKQQEEPKFKDLSNKVECKKQTLFCRTTQINTRNEFKEFSSEFHVTRNGDAHEDASISSLELKTNTTSPVYETNKGKHSWINLDPSLSQEITPSQRNGKRLQKYSNPNSTSLTANKLHINSSQSLSEISSKPLAHGNEIASPDTDRIYAASTFSLKTSSKKTIKSKTNSPISIRDNIRDKYYSQSESYGKLENCVGHLNKVPCALEYSRVIPTKSTEFQKENNRCDEAMFKKKISPSTHNSSGISVCSVTKIEPANTVKMIEGSDVCSKPINKNSEQVSIVKQDFRNKSIVNNNKYDVRALDTARRDSSDESRLKNSCDANIPKNQLQYLKTKNKITKKLLVNRGLLKDISNMFCSTSQLQVHNNVRRSLFTNNNSNEIEANCMNNNLIDNENSDPKLFSFISKKKIPFKNNSKNFTGTETEPLLTPSLSAQDNLEMSKSNTIINNRMTSHDKKCLLAQSAKKINHKNQILSKKTKGNTLESANHLDMDTSNKYSEGLNYNASKKNPDYMSPIEDNKLRNQRVGSVSLKTTSHIPTQRREINASNIGQSKVMSKVKPKYVTSNILDITNTPRHLSLKTIQPHCKPQENKAYSNVLPKIPEYSKLSNFSSRNNLQTHFTGSTPSNDHHSYLDSDISYNYALTSDEEEHDSHINSQSLSVNGQLFNRTGTYHLNGNGKRDMQVHNHEEDSSKRWKSSIDNLSDACITDDTDDDGSIISEDNHRKEFSYTISDDEDREHRLLPNTSSPPTSKIASQVYSTDNVYKDHASDQASTMKTDPSFPSMSEMEFQYSSPLASNNDENSLAEMFEKNSSPLRSCSSYSSDVY